MNRPSTFAKRLRELLDIHHITQTELSQKTGISKSSISRYLKGDWEAKQDAIYAISRFTNVNEAWLMGYDVPMNKFDKLSDREIINAVDEMFEPEDAIELLSRFAVLNEDDRAFLMETLDLLLIRRSLNPGSETRIEVTMGSRDVQKRPPMRAAARTGVNLDDSAPEDIILPDEEDGAPE